MANNKDKKTLNVPNSTDEGKAIRNVPHLRFPEFTEEWKKIRVSELLDFYSTNSLAWEQLNYENGDIKNLHYGLIHRGLPTIVDLEKECLPFININSEPKNYTLCQNGDIAFADASEDTNDVAKIIEFKNCADNKVVCGLHTIHGRDKSNATSVGFKGYAFSSDSFHKQIRRIAQGTKIYSISSKNFNETFIGVPSKDEQTKISKLLSVVDKRIAIQNKIIDKLETLIKGIAYNVANSGKKEYQISDCLECHTSTLQENSLSESGYYPAYGASGISGYTNNASVHGESILIIKDGSNVGTVSYAKGDYSVIGTLNYLTAKKGFNIRYLYFCLKVFDFTPYKSGMAIPHIYFKDYSKAKIYCPQIDEQNRIANILSKLEYKLSIEQNIRLLSLFQKQYLLQQMFI